MTAIATVLEEVVMALPEEDEKGAQKQKQTEDVLLQAFFSEVYDTSRDAEVERCTPRPTAPRRAAPRRVHARAPPRREEEGGRRGKPTSRRVAD